VLVCFLLALIFIVAWFQQPVELAAVYFLKQDVPILCVMVLAAVVYARTDPRARWQGELRISRSTTVAGAALLLLVCYAGNQWVMLGQDHSRDEAMATLAAKQIASGSLITFVPEEWHAFGRAMLPIFYNDVVPPQTGWISGYLPVNSAIRALVEMGTGTAALANPALLIIGLFALWTVARRIWPDRHDVAVVVLLLAATSSQLVVSAMTSYAMTGHFALNAVWLALFLRGGRLGIAGALGVAFLTTGLHQIHFHPMFAAPFVLWLAVRGDWRQAILYAAGYLAIGLFWWVGYPQWLLSLTGDVVSAPAAAAAVAADGSLLEYLMAKAGRLFESSPLLLLLNLARFAAWQNLLLLPLALGALSLLRSEGIKRSSLVLPLVAACAIGLALMVYQGHGWGYRYLHGLIGCFCLLAGYGWCRLVPVPGPSREWAALKLSCCLSLLVLMPAQFVMARAFVAPSATLERAIRSAPADVVLVDTANGFFAQDLVQNSPDFSVSPKTMDLAFVPLTALESLCRDKKVLRVDHRHYRAVGMRSLPGGAALNQQLEVRRAQLARLGCAPPLEL
jgi:hypothetical protein